MIRLKEAGTEKIIWINAQYIGCVEEIVPDLEGAHPWVNIELVNGTTYSVAGPLHAIVEVIEAQLRVTVNVND